METVKARLAELETVKAKLAELGSLPKMDKRSSLYDKRQIMAKMNDLQNLFNHHPDQMEKLRRILAVILWGKVVLRPQNKGRKRYSAAELWGNTLGIMELAGGFPLISYSGTPLLTMTDNTVDFKVKIKKGKK